MTDYTYDIPLLSKEIFGLLHKISEFWKLFIAENKYNFQAKFYHRGLLEVCDKVHKRRIYYKIFHKIDMSDIKEIALYVYWILKIKPFYNKDNRDDIINSKFALFLLWTGTGKISNTKLHREHTLKPSDNFFDYLEYSLHYHDLSKEAIIQIAETLHLAQINAK